MDFGRAFVVDENPHSVPKVFIATKSDNPPYSARVGQKKMTTIAVREQGTEKFSKFLCFMYTVPASIRDRLNTWILVPKNNYSFSKVLFTSKKN